MIHELITINSKDEIGRLSHLNGTITIQAQQATGSCSTGGNLKLYAGTGIFKKEKPQCQLTNIDATLAYMNGKTIIPLNQTLQRCAQNLNVEQKLSFASSLWAPKVW